MIKIPLIVDEFYRKQESSNPEILFNIILDDQTHYRIFTKDSALTLNIEFDIHERLPGYFAVGSTLGDELICVDYHTGKVYEIAIFPMDKTERIEICQSLNDLLSLKHI